MQVILKKDIEKLGYADDIVDVRPGYANNFLIPQGYAISATESAKKVLAETLKQRAHKEAKFVADAEALAAKLAEVTLTITAKAEEGRIFGSVTAANLAEALEKQGISVDRKNIALDAVKTVGQYEATVNSVVNLHGTQYLLRLAEESLPKGESQGKLWMLYTGVRCRFLLMVKQKFLVDDEPSASAIIKEEQIFSYVVNAERGSSI